MLKIKIGVLLAALSLFATQAHAQAVTVVADCNIGISPALGTNTAQPGTITTDTAGRLCNSPSTASQITGNASGSTAAVVGTLAAAAAKKTYICGFSVSALGTANTPGPIVVAGLVGSSMTFQASTLASGVAQQIGQTFAPCIPSSAVNTAITVTTTAAAGGTAINVNSWGYQQ